MRAILESLPDWFGDPAARARYADRAAVQETFGLREGGTWQAVLSLAVAAEAASEIDVLAVRPERHRAGLGRRLVDEAVRRTALRGHGYLVVKTLSAHAPSAAYARTRRFYAAMGFAPLAELPGLWGPDAPCLLMVRPVSPSAAGAR